MSHLIARYSRLGTPTKWFGGLALCLAALLLIVVSAVSDNPPDGGPFGAEFRLLSAPVAQPSGAWRISWTSVSGKTYQLQRTANDDLNSANWVEVATLIATGPVTYYDDSTAARLRFYRVKLVETVTTSYFVGDPDFFVPLSASGQPIEGGQIQVAANGLLAALELRPGNPALKAALETVERLELEYRLCGWVQVPEAEQAKAGKQVTEAYRTALPNGVPVENVRRALEAVGLEEEPE